MQALSTKITPFDALKYTGILTKKGFSKDQATALLEAQKSAFSDMMLKNDTIFLKYAFEFKERFEAMQAQINTLLDAWLYPYRDDWHSA